MSDAMNNMGEMHGRIMNHEKMTFVELEAFRLPEGTIAQLAAIERSAARINLKDTVLQTIIHYILSKPRYNQAALTTAQRNAFNNAVSAAIAAGTYQNLVDIHAAPHMMHGFMGYSGMLRFLPWHRAYLYQMEKLLQSYIPGVTIPYWDWAHDNTLPTWVLLPSGVTRGPDTSWHVANQAEINADVLSRTDYVQFTDKLERKHNTVHNYVGGNTMPFPSISPRDPLFWLHHANVDRIWSQWQDAGTRPNPPLSGTDAVMDPWTLTTNDVLDTFNLWFYYA